MVFEKGRKKEGRRKERKRKRIYISIKKKKNRQGGLGTCLSFFWASRGTQFSPEKACLPLLLYLPCKKKNSTTSIPCTLPPPHFALRRREGTGNRVGLGVAETCMIWDRDNI